MESRLPQSTPTFEAEVFRFQEFLRANRWSERIVWIQPQDLLLTGKQFCYLKMPVPKSRDTAARQAFDKGIQEGRGVLLASRLELQGTSYCYIWVPANDDEAMRALMPAGVKLSIPNDRVPVRLIRNRLLWWWLTFRLKQKQSNKEWLFQ